MTDGVINPKAGEVVGERYVIERLLGEGGMGAVYLARHNVTNRRVALKWVHTDNKLHRQRVIREARAMGALSHPNVVGVLDAGEHQGSAFTVMEYVEGKNLRDYADGRKLAYRDAVDLLLPAMSGVAAAHQAGILHRDLKPENLFVCTDRDGTPFDTKVLDFGVAKPLGGDTSLTSTGMLVGTPRYMAPEQITAGESVDARMDVYALGLILYELLTGDVPFRATDLKPLVIEIITGMIPPISQIRPDVPKGLDQAVMRALTTERDARFPQVGSFARALEPFAGRRRYEPPRRVHTPDALASQRPPAPAVTALATQPEQPVPGKVQSQAAYAHTAQAGLSQRPAGSKSAGELEARLAGNKRKIFVIAGGVVALTLFVLGVGMALRSKASLKSPESPPALSAPSSLAVQAPEPAAQPAAAQPPVADAPPEPTPAAVMPSVPIQPEQVSNPPVMADDASTAREENHKSRSSRRREHVSHTSPIETSSKPNGVQVRGGTLKAGDF